MLFASDCRNHIRAEFFSTREIQSPELIHAKQALSQLEDIQSFHDALEIFSFDPTQFTDVKNESSLNGRGFLRIQSAIYESQKIFIKTVHTFNTVDGRYVPEAKRNLRNVVDEIRAAKFLEAMKWGPKLLGVYANEEAFPCLVYEYVEGTHITTAEHFPPLNPAAKDKAKSKLRRIKAVLSTLQLAHYDVQLRIDSEGNLKIIDAETLILSPTKNMSEREDPNVQYQKFIDALNQ